MGPDLAVALISVIGVITVGLVAAVTRFATRHASNLSHQAVELAGELREELGKERQRLADHIEADKRGKAARNRLYTEHSMWDQQVAEQLRQAGMPVSDPPPLHEEE